MIANMLLKVRHIEEGIQQRACTILAAKKQAAVIIFLPFNANHFEAGIREKACIILAAKALSKIVLIVKSIVNTSKE
jgi:hypothetical protein